MLLPNSASISGEHLVANGTRPSLFQAFRTPYAALMLLYVLLVGLPILFKPLDQAITFSAIDDALYYPKIAYNIVQRGMCSYDGVTATNGFHPLWLISLLPVAWLVPDPDTGARAIYFIMFLINGLSLLLLCRLARH